jgi:MFS family permease
MGTISTVRNPVQTRTGARRWLHVSFPLLISFSVAQLVKSSVGIVVASPVFVDRFHIASHAAAVGWVSSSFLYAYGAALLAWGYIVKRSGPRTAMLAGSAIWVLALAFTPFINTMAEL